MENCELKTKLKNLETQYLSLKTTHSNLLLQVKLLENHVQTQLTAIQLQLQQIQQTQLHKCPQMQSSDAEITIVKNCQSLINNLPFNSPIRRPLLKELGTGVEASILQKLFSISKSSYQRIQHENSKDSLLYIKYAPFTTKNRFSEEELNKAREELDKWMKVPSGRSYRIRIKTLRQIYHEYVQFASGQGRIPLKWKLWLDKIFHQEHIQLWTIIVYVHTVKS